MRPALLSLGLLAALTPAAAAETGDYAITVYSSAQPGQLDSERLADYGAALPGYALVRDRRTLRLEAGRSLLRFEDVAARMDPSTTSFESLTDPDGTRVVEQNYQFDLVSGDKLLERYIGQTITVQQAHGDRVEETRGELLSARGGLTLRLDSGEIATLQSWSGIRFPSLPGGLISRPSLLWLIDAERGGEHEVRVAYQARGMTWWADYNLVLDGDKGCQLELGAWVTLVNQSGASFPNAGLKLVAGEVNRIEPPMDRIMVTGSRVPMMTEAQADGFSESGLFEYHLYSLGRRTDLPDNSTKQIELFPAASAVPCRRELVFTASPRHFAYGSSANTNQGFAATSSGEVGAWLEFDNRERDGLGIALPAGRVRVNQADAEDGSLQFIGEDTIGHTPRNETLRLRLGSAFDVVGERRQTAFRVDTAAKRIEESFTVELRNRKHEAVDLVVRETLYRWSDWRITESSHAQHKRDARTVDFPLTLAADSEVELSYTVVYTW